ncbi:MAG: ABC transporter transmembrane domain-containing protein, partial [Chloroflexota bacterium]
DGPNPARAAATPATPSTSRSAARDGSAAGLLTANPATLSPERLDEWRLAAAALVDWAIRQFGAGAVAQAVAGHDPARRDRALAAAFRMSLGTMEEDWLKQAARSGERSVFRALVGQLIPLFRPYWRRQLETFAYVAFDIAFGIALPLATKYLIDTVLPGKDVGGLLLVIGAMLALFLIDVLAGMRRAYVNAWINERVIIDLKLKLFSRIQALPQAFHARSSVGDLMERMGGDVDDLEAVLWQLASSSVVLVLRAFFAAVTLLALNPLLGLFAIATVPVFGLGYLLLRRRIEEQSVQVQRLWGDAAAMVQEALASVAMTRAFGAEQRVIGRFRDVLQARTEATMRLIVTSSLYEASNKLAQTLGQLLIFAVGGWMVIRGDLTSGGLMAFIALLPSLFLPVAAISGLGQQVQQAAGALDRVEEVLDEPLTIADAPGARPAGPPRQGIALQEVSFGYEPGRPILDRLSLEIPAGSNVAIVGQSGCGKSTLVGLLLRFHDPGSGRVLLDGADLREFAIASVRGQAGIVFQETFVFNSSLRENIAVGRTGASDAEIAGAAEAAHLGELIASLPAGLDTVLGERGVRISGGQRQRLAIARALLRDPEILILDEATSALDPQTEADLLPVLRGAARGRTTISITHRLGSLREMDRIFVLERGRLAEEGTFAGLMAAGGLFRRLHDRQQDAADGGARLANEPIDVLRRAPVFAGLGEDDLREIAAAMSIADVPAGVEIVRQGDEADAFYLVLDGMTEVSVGSGRAERPVARLGGGDCFGEIALLAGGPRTATVRALTLVRLAVLTREGFAAALGRSPRLRDAFGRLMDARLGALAAVANAEDGLVMMTDA